MTQNQDPDRETTLPPESPDTSTTRATTKTKRKHHPVLVFLNAVREIGNQVAIIKVKWLVAGMLVFLFSVVLTQVQFNGFNTRERDKIVQENENADYVNDLTAYNQSLITYQACLDGVARSDGNRLWKNWLLDKLGSTFAESPAAQEIVTEGRAKLEEYLPPRSIEDCVSPGQAPTPPEGDE